MDFLVQLDRELFRMVNQLFTYDVLDFILPFMREKKNWIPLYILLAFIFIKQFKWKKGSLAILLALCTIAVSDTLSSKIIKPLVARARPCHDEADIIHRLLIDCGGGFSFTSSHATNHFALAVYLGWVSFALFKPSKKLFLTWAFLISYAQVYVGVHYPLDVICGGLLGSLIGYGFYRGFILMTDTIS